MYRSRYSFEKEYITSHNKYFFCFGLVHETNWKEHFQLQNVRGWTTKEVTIMPFISCMELPTT